MFWDIFFSLLFAAVVIYLVIGIFYDMNEFEWSVVRWFKRTFHLCDHPYGAEYKVVEYLAGNLGEYPEIVLELRCSVCHKPLGQWMVSVETIADMENIVTVVGDSWHCMNVDELNEIRKNGKTVH